MTRLPALRSLAASIRSTRRGKQTLADAADYLVDHRAELALFQDPEHLAISTDKEYALPGTTESTIRTARALSYSIAALRSEIGKELWARQIFIGPEVLDELIFYVAREGHGAEPVVGVLEWIRDAWATRPGLLIFPLHSLGVLGAGLLGPAKGRVSFVNASRGYALTPQTNDLNRTIEFLDDTRAVFGIGQALPIELLRHWRRSRPTGWLERNPLLVVRTVYVPGSYYDSEWLLVSRVRAATGLLAMLVGTAAGARRPRLPIVQQPDGEQLADARHPSLPDALRWGRAPSRARRTVRPYPFRTNLRVRAERSRDRHRSRRIGVGGVRLRNACMTPWTLCTPSTSVHSSRGNRTPASERCGSSSSPWATSGVGSRGRREAGLGRSR